MPASNHVRTNTSNSRALIGSLIVGALFFAGCASSSANKASSAPDHAQSKDSAADIAFKKAEKRDTLASYEAFLKSYPDSRWKEEALGRIREKKEADDQMRAQIETWDLKTALDYIEQSPRGKFRPDVIATIDRRKLATVFQADSLIVSAATVDEPERASVKQPVRPKSGHSFVTIACRINHFADRGTFDIKDDEIVLAQGDGTTFEVLSRELTRPSGPKSHMITESSFGFAGPDGKIISPPGTTRFVVDGMATILVRAEVPVAARNNLVVSLKGKPVPVAVPPTEK